jgi:hypothetical protein
MGKVSCESVVSQQGHEHGTMVVSIVRSRYIATPHERVEALMFAVVICRVCRSVKMFVEELLFSLTLQSAVLVCNISYHSSKKGRVDIKGLVKGWTARVA